MALNIEKLRGETRGCENLIHFNNAGASLMPAPVIDAVRDFLQSEEYNGGYETSESYAKDLNNFYVNAAKFIGALPEEIAFTDSATRAWQMAYYAMPFKPGDRVLASVADYGATVVNHLQQAERLGVSVEFVPNDEHGQIDVNQLNNLLDDRVKLISLCHMPTGGGLINPAAVVGDIAKRAGIPFFLDTCQSIGHVDIKVDELGCDVLCATGRKYLRGPRGTGFLYVRNQLLQTLEPPILDHHSAILTSETSYQLDPTAKRFEVWEQNLAGKYGLSKAISYASELGIKNIARRIQDLAGYFREQLQSLNRAVVMDEGVHKSGLVTFLIEGISTRDIQQYLKQNGINASVSSRSAGSLVSFSRRSVESVVRASVHYFNTEEEIDCCIELLEKLTKAG